MMEQAVNDLRYLLRGFLEIVARPHPQEPGDSTGIELCLVKVAPDIQALELVYALLHDRPLQKMIQPPPLDQPQAFPL